MKKIAIIGYGAATIGFLLGFLEKNLNQLREYEIDIYDKNSEDNAGGLGLNYDGKLIIGQYAGSDKLIPMEIQNKILSFFLSFSNCKKRQITEQEQNFIKQFQNEIYRNNMLLSKQKTFHLGTDQLKQVNKKILSHFKNFIKINNLNIRFYFDSYIDPDYFFYIKQHYNTVIIAVGRYGTNLINTIVENYDGKQNLILSNNKIDLGIRFQLPSDFFIIEKLDKILHQWKIIYKTQNNLMVRTFCHNPKGFVVTQNLDILGEKITIVNGHSKKNELSNNTNFAILVTQEFTQPFNDSVLYGKIVSQEANLLAGSNERVILQTVKDFQNKKRTKHLFRVHPTLEDSKYMLGDLTYVLPAKIYESLIQFLNVLSNIIPEILYPDNLIYGMETKFYNTKMNDTKQYKFIGDCSGKSRNLISAASSGYILSKTL